LENSSDNIIDIALDLGFEYPEVFSRTFKKHYGISPSAYRMVRPSVEALPRALVISRNLVAFQGKVTLKADFIPVEPFILHGLSADVDTNSPDFKESLEQLSDMANKRTVEMKHLNQDKFYSVVNCHGDGSDTYTVFSGREAVLDINSDLGTRRVPGGWYAKFIYKGDMFDIRETFVDDLYRWIAVKEVEMASNGIGMISVFDEEYIKSKIVKILIPVKEPKT
jgi:AraC family transcriptional regulator